MPTSYTNSNDANCPVNKQTMVASTGGPTGTDKDWTSTDGVTKVILNTLWNQNYT